MKTFSIPGNKKIPWKVILTDEISVTLQPPRLRSFLNMKVIDDNIDDLNQTENLIEACGIIANVLSENLEKRTFTADEVADIFDYGSMEKFINEYTKYMEEVTGEKNS